jgi:hypothetical protein
MALQMRALVGPNSKTVLDDFAAKLANAKKLKDFIALLRQGDSQFYSALFAQPDGPPLFETIISKVMDFVTSRGEIDQDDNFAQLMACLPVCNRIDPGTGSVFMNPVTGDPLTFDVFDVVPIQTLDDRFKKIFDKWLKLWPVYSRQEPINAMVFPNQFGAWLAGNLLGAATSAADLQTHRHDALTAIYDEWLETMEDNAGSSDSSQPSAPPTQPFPVTSYTDFAALLQLVPSDFWSNWLKDQKDSDAFVAKRKQIWERIQGAWQGVRVRNTGWIDFPFLQVWSQSNPEPWPPKPDPADAPDPLAQVEAFRQGRRGRIWA